MSRTVVQQDSVHPQSTKFRSHHPCANRFRVFRRICGLENDRAARLGLDRRVLPPTFAFAPPRKVEGEAKAKAGGLGEVHARRLRNCALKNEW
jgi:hypothetical protein